MDFIEGGKKQVHFSLVIKKIKHLVDIMKIDYQLIWTLFMKAHKNISERRHYRDPINLYIILSKLNSPNIVANLLTQ